jgi:hypothetical protein
VEIGDKVIFRLNDTKEVIEGTGVIFHIDPAAIVPLQVELDEPKIFGQKFCRFYHNEVELNLEKSRYTRKQEVELKKGAVKPNKPKKVPEVELKRDISAIEEQIIHDMKVIDKRGRKKKTPKEPKDTFRTLEEKGQMNLFDFI